MVPYSHCHCMSVPAAAAAAPAAAAAGRASTAAAASASAGRLQHHRWQDDEAADGHRDEAAPDEEGDPQRPLCCWRPEKRYKDAEQCWKQQMARRRKEISSRMSSWKR